MLVLLGLVACGGSAPERYTLTGTVVEVRDDSLLVAHDDIDGFMTAMTMPLSLANPTDARRVREGDTIEGTLLVGRRTVLTDVVVSARSAAPERAARRPRAERQIAVGATFPATHIPLAGGRALTLGEDQAGPVALTFIYTRCPLPEYCPLVMRRVLGLQAALPAGARSLLVTLDPDYDTLEVLAAFGKAHGAIPGRTELGRLPKENLVGLAERAGLTAHGAGLQISHDLVLVVIDADGRVAARYRDMAWDQGEVLAHLTD